MTDAGDRKSVLAAVRSGRLGVDDAVRLLQRDVSSVVAPASEPDTNDWLLKQLQVWLAEVLAAEARVEIAPDRPDLPLEHYGFDSVMAVNVVRALERSFGPLPTTLLFEHQSIEALADHFVANYRDTGRRLVHQRVDSETTHSTTEPDRSADIAKAAGSPEALPPHGSPPATASSTGHPGTAETAPERRPRGEDIAIVGLSCRFPIAENIDQFWDKLVAGRDCITEVPGDRWDPGRDFDPTPGKPGKTYTKWGGFIADVDRFDAGFFHISPREAERMDPQERLLLQEVWHAMEDGGLTRDGLSAHIVGVYVGVMYSQYQLLQAEQRVLGNPLFLGSSYASIANRVSYTFNFRGPSMAVDTMCSSSLTAIHLACEALRSGDIDVAVTGGVSLSIHQNKYIDLSQGRYASHDGRCRSFGAGGTGYVPGEGVGVAILKPLRIAEAAGDRIHAVIRGSALGHGGKTNGYSVPNPAEQSRVITTAIRRAGVDPTRISYIEAHGTGTALGDPIEVAALSRALATRTAAGGACALGSVKSNIGHLESAAGIAGLIKVVLQMRHRQLVPSLHADTLNPDIDFTATPLRVQRTLAQWVIPPGQDRRISGISSFGAGGTNAHVIVEEYVDAEPHGGELVEGPELIVLSAANEERLREQARLLAERLADGGEDGRDDRHWLADVAYTLRCGRQPLDERLAMVVDTAQTAVRGLLEFADSGRAADGVRGGVGHPLSDRADRDIAEALTYRDLDRLARLWAAGRKVDWAQLDRVPRRKVALPTYPFERERHWPLLVTVPPHEDGPPSAPATSESGSNVEYSVTAVVATDPLLRDHIVHGRHVLPGAAIVDLVRAAADRFGLTAPIVVEDMIFRAPVAVEHNRPYDLTVELTQSGERVEFLVWSRSQIDGERVVHASGRVSSGADTAIAFEPNAVVAECAASVDGAACYRILAERGLDYGPTLRVLDQVHRGSWQALAALRDDTTQPGHDVLPAVLDGAFQTLVAFESPGAAGAALVPFAIDRLELLAPVDTARWVHVRARPGSADRHGKPRVFDLDVARANGQIALRIQGLAVRPAACSASEGVIVRPRWIPADPVGEVDSRDTRRVLLVDHGGDPDGALAEALREAPEVSELIRVRPSTQFWQMSATSYMLNPADNDDWARLLTEVGDTDGLDIVHVHGSADPAGHAPVSPELLEAGFYCMLALAKALARRSSGASVRQLYVHPVTSSGTVPAHTAAAAFGRALAAEHPGFHLATLAIDATRDGRVHWSPAHVAQLWAELAGHHRSGDEIRYVDGERQRRVHGEASDVANTATDSTLRPQGVYFVTGGLGGLGRTVARHLAERYHARLVLVGRSALPPAGAELLTELTVAGGEAIYVAADISTQEGAREAVRLARSAFGHIDGVLHLAGVLRDGLIFGKQRSDAEAVLCAKIWGAYHLDRATHDEPLDFFALFSSASSVLGIPGQTDYAYANGFLNAFATWREGRRRAGDRSGRTVSVAWPLWESGGMAVDDATKTAIRRDLGWVPMPDADGLRLLEMALGSADAEQAVFFGDPVRILRTLGPTADALPKRPADPASSSGNATRSTADVTAAPMSNLERALLVYLRQIVAAELKLPLERLDPHRRFDQLGVESVMAMNVTAKLEAIFGKLPKTLFFEYQSVAELTRHLVATHPAAVAAAFGPATLGTTVDDVPEELPPAAPVAGGVSSTPSSSVSARWNAHSAAQVPRSEPIAIVGLAGRYPMADTVEELWENLRTGRDCITEIPQDRWDHAPFFDLAVDLPGRSYSKWGGFLRDVDRFDPLFFNISPREARQMDPQERLFLETAWHTLEDSGHTRRSLAEQRIGVFVGVMYAQYQLYGANPHLQATGFVPASLSASVANRVSYVFDFKGPSIALDTMCSSSLTALHMACAGIWLGDCDEALVGGVNAILHPNRYLQLSQGRFASTDGRCRSFGAGGDGYVPGEGVGAVLLKPLHRAEADGDHIYAVIRGTGVNHGGRSNGYTVPTPVAQAELIGRTLRRAGVDPADVDYIEAHGTGTALGDPIEIAGLAKAFAELGGRGGARSCPVGSIKSNIGHLESAAGIAGLTKVLLQLRHGELAPSLHAERLNSDVQFDSGPFHVQRTLEPWPVPVADGRRRPRVATVSAFGAGGANAHAVIEEYLPAAAVPSGPSDGPELIMLSARTEGQLRELAQRLADRLDPSTVGERLDVRVSRLVSELQAILGGILSVPSEDIPPDDDLDSLGLDPVVRAELVNQFGQRSGVEVPATTAMEWRSLRDLATRLAIGAGEPTDGSPRPAIAADCRLRDIAFTLQVGREPMDERLAFVADSLRETASRLRRFAVGQPPPEVLQGRVSGEDVSLAQILDGHSGEAFVASLRRNGDLDKLTRLWITGVDLPPSGCPGRRVSLTLYPFARNRYWIPIVEETAGTPSGPTVREPARHVKRMSEQQDHSPPPDGDAAWTPVTDVIMSTATDAAPLATAEESLEVRAEAVWPVSRSEIQRVIVSAMAAVLEVPPEEFAPDLPHVDFGIDSVLAVEIVDRINRELGIDLRPTDFFSYATLRRLVDHVEGLSAALPAATPAQPDIEASLVVPGTPSTTSRPAALRPVAARPALIAVGEVAATDVAVIGMSARFPEADDLDQFWGNLAAGRDSVREIPADRWDVHRYWDPDPQASGKTYSKWGSILADAGQFDPDFFGISPREARLMDPQQRLYLVETWRALESAGYSDRTLDGLQCHSFVGTGMGDYHHLLRTRGVALEGYTFTGTHPAILASRASYLLNLKGPSMAVDTSCSSSLMAVHLACEAIREGHAELAVAGGVAALFTPELHILASKAGMLSPTGRCRAFAEAADGFVPGEGVGVVVLKGLAQALRDGDPIRGVILGSGANQDGRTNGITAPSAPSQAALETAVYERFGINPATIGYVECHGTGTRLGDPIEIEALTNAFRRYTDRNGYCAVGSVKSNLGHTLTAAGIAGLLKTLLCLEHRQLVPSLHVTETNRYILFDRTPFYVNAEPRDWTPEPGVPRLAAVSSFGFSGTNVHVVVREALDLPRRPPEATDQPRLVPVSAKTRQALAEVLARLERWLGEHGSAHEWRDIVFTLGIGRSHFAERAAFIAVDPRDLREQIRAWLDEPTRYRDKPASNRVAAAAATYRAGGSVDWRALYAGEPCRRIPLPTYPFATETYWVPAPAAAEPTLPETASPDGDEPAPDRELADVPLVLRHTLRPNDPLVRDHVVDQQPLLPAAGHLAFVYQALRRVLGDTPITLHRAVWLRPVFVAAERQIEVVITIAPRGRLSFEVRSTGPDGTAIVHSRGEARTGAAEAEHIDVVAVRARCRDSISSAEHYGLFDRMGVLYGPYFRTVQGIDLGASEAVTRLAYEEPASGLPASVLDGAIQSVAALDPETEEGQRPHVPFAMDQIRILAPVPFTSFAYVRQSRADECTVTIVDSDGRPCIVIDGLSYRELKASLQTLLYTPRWRHLGLPQRGAMPDSGRTVIVTTGRDHGLAEQIAAYHARADVTIARLDSDDLTPVLASDGLPRRVYFLGGLDDGHDERGPEAGGRTRTDSLSIEAVERSQDHGVRALFHLVKHLLHGGVANHHLDLVIVTANAHQVRGGERTRPFAASLFGFVRSLAKEQKSWRVRCIDIDAKELSGPVGNLVVEAVVNESAHPRGNEVALRDGRRWALELIPARATPPDCSPFRANGTYVIVGGTGGIGGQLALHLARRAAANVVLIGRRPSNAQIEQQLRAIEGAGGSGIYLNADVTDAGAVAEAVSAAKARFGPIHGVFHSALVLRDSQIAKMDSDGLDSALAPKVRGSVVLANAVCDEPLDMFVFFSSAQSFSGNEGQANYAAACTFKDAFGLHLASAGVPVHIVNWGYWGDVGAVAKAGYRRRMQAIGVHSISAAEGMRALEAIIANRLLHAMPLKAEPRVLDKFEINLAGAAASAPPDNEWNPLANKVVSVGVDGSELRRAHAELDKFAVHLVMRAIQQMGAFRKPGERRSTARLGTELGVVADHARLWATLLDILTARGLLDRDAGELCATPVVADVVRWDLPAEGHRLRQEHPAVSAHVDLLECCLQEYPRLLRGEVEPTEVMFPGGSMTRVEGVYRGDPLSDQLNALAASAVVAYLEQRPTDVKVRVLEVGAGTGGTSKAVFDALAPYSDRVEYVYTDVSLGFLRHGRRLFGKRKPSVTFQKLDIELDPAEQGYGRGEFDVVVAANVLHATRDLRTTLKHVGWLTAARGWLVLVETTAFSIFAACTFGLLDGWWRWTDAERIPGSPLADVPTWERLLTAAGFARTAVLGPTSGDVHSQHTLIGERAAVASELSRDETAPVRATAAPVPAEREPHERRPGELRQWIHDVLAASITESLGRSDSDIEPDRPFTDYGVDSIIMVELVSSFNARLGIDLPTTALFDNPTLTQLTDFICTEFSDRLPALRTEAEPTAAEAMPHAQPADELDLLRQLAAGELSLEDTYARLELAHE